MPLSPASYIIGSHAYFFREGGAISSVTTSASRARNGSGVATIVTATAHGLWTGATVTMTNFGGTGYNLGPLAVTVINATSFTYVSAGTLETTATDVAGVITLTGTASASFKPGPNDANWITIGNVEESSDSREGNDIEIYAPQPGKIVLTDVIRNKHKLTLKFTAQEWGPFAAEVQYLTENLTSASTQFNPLEGDDKKGWLKMQRYDQNDNLRLVMDVWCRISISGDVQFGGSDIVKPAFEALVLHSALNTGTL